jgi:hypothetical protein
LASLETLSWERKTKKEFVVPYRTLHSVIEKTKSKKLKTDIHKDAKERAKLIRLFRKYEPELLHQLELENNGASLWLTPVLDFYERFHKVPHFPKLIEVKKKDALVKAPPFGWKYADLPLASSVNSFMTKSISSSKISKDSLSSWILRLGYEETFLVPLLRLYDSALQRPILLVFDFDALQIPGVSSRPGLISFISTQWPIAKSMWPFNECLGKKEVLSDLTDARLHFAENFFPCFSGICTVATIEAIFSSQLQLPNFVLGTLCQQSGMKRAQRHFFLHQKPCASVADFVKLNRIQLVQISRLESMCEFPAIVMSDEADILLSSDEGGLILFEVPSQVKVLRKRPEQSFGSFLKNTELPSGLEITENGILLSDTKDYSGEAIELEFRWYRRRTGIIESEHLFNDACLLLKNGIPRHLSSSSSECSLKDLFQTFGIQCGLDRFVRIVHDNHSYPKDVEPIFDLQMITPDTQSQAFEIHRLTGNFSEFIIGYHNTLFQESILLQDVCMTMRHNSKVSRTKLDQKNLSKESWVSDDFLTRFSAKDFCLLKASIFLYLDPTNLDSFQEMFTSVTLRVKQTDLDLLKADAKQLLSLQDLVSLSIECGAPNAEGIVSDYLNSSVNVSGFFLIQTDGKLDFQLMHRCCLREPVEWTCSSNLSVDILRADFKRWLSNRLRGRNMLVPRLPCVVRLRENQMVSKLVTFDTQKDEWTLWNGKVIFAVKRAEFDILENDRCLPALVRTLGETNSMGKATSKVLDAEGQFWITLDGGVETRMIFGKEFHWEQSVFVNASDMMARDEVREYQFLDHPDGELFNESGALKVEISLIDEEPSPAQGCQDWVLVNYFNKNDGIRAFVDFLGLNVTNRILYEAYEGDEADEATRLNCFKEMSEAKGLSQRTRDRIVCAARWLWNRLESWDYRMNIWITQLKDFKRNDPKTLEHVLDLVYGWYSNENYVR